jgi:hypothetical protein
MGIFHSIWHSFLRCIFSDNGGVGCLCCAPTGSKVLGFLLCLLKPFRPSAVCWLFPLPGNGGRAFAHRVPSREDVRSLPPPPLPGGFLSHEKSREIGRNFLISSRLIACRFTVPTRPDTSDVPTKGAISVRPPLLPFVHLNLRHLHYAVPSFCHRLGGLDPKKRALMKRIFSKICSDLNIKVARISRATYLVFNDG